MTIIALGTDVPSNINSVERLLAWSGLALAVVNPRASVLEAYNRNEAVAQAVYFQAADQSQRLLIRACVPVSPDYTWDRTIKLWMHTQEISGTALPAGFKAN